MDTLEYHYQRFALYYHIGRDYPSPPECRAFRTNYQQVVEQIGRNSWYGRNATPSYDVDRWWRPYSSIDTRWGAVIQAQHNSRLIEYPDW